MIFRDETARKTPQLDLTSLINVVFLLLIFFMLAGSLKPAETIESAKVDAERSVADNLLVVTVDHTGIAMIDSEPLSDRALSRRLRVHAQNAGKAGIKPDARLDAQRLVQLTELLRQTGFDTVTLMTQQRSN